jgi:hypothetical protein
MFLLKKKTIVKVTVSGDFRPLIILVSSREPTKSPFDIFNPNYCIPGPGRTLKYLSPLSFDLAFTRSTVN